MLRSLVRWFHRLSAAAEAGTFDAEPASWFAAPTADAAPDDAQRSSWFQSQRRVAGDRRRREIDEHLRQQEATLPPEYRAVARRVEAGLQDSYHDARRC